MTKPTFYRAGLEGIAYSFIYGMEVMQEMGLQVRAMKVGDDNLFQSQVFSTTIASVLDCEIEMCETTGAIGAAKAAGVGCGVYKSREEAFSMSKIVKTYQADSHPQIHRDSYEDWKSELKKLI